MAQRLLLLVAVALAVVGHVAHADVPSNSTPPPACAGFECPDYEIIDTLTGGTQIRKYEEGMWVKYPVPNDDFIFMAEYGSERLGQFFEGENYEHKVIKKSTPLRVEFNVWDITEQRYASYFVPLESQTLPPAAIPPARIDKYGETFIFAREYNSTMDFRVVAKNVAEAMVDLTVDREPFQLDSVFLAMYGYPKQGGGPRQNDEIWLLRTFKHWDSPTVPVLREAAANASQVLDYVQRKMLQ